MLTWVLAAAALAAGVTGAWSPCGFSMVETLAPAGYAGRLRTTLVACVTFTLGALAGGVLTFGGLAMLGEALGAGGTGAAVVAAAIAVAAAVGEARGLRIVPQVRRQVPESWRRVLPVPLAAGLYGVLLGLGFTTFILTFAVWALAAVSVALGDPALGAVLGLAFGAGRALPVIALAPIADGDRGNAAHAAMAERPAILRGLRAADAVALALCAAVIGVAPAQAAEPRASAAAATIAAAAASGPAADAGLFAFQRPGGTGYLRRGGDVRAPRPRPRARRRARRLARRGADRARRPDHARARRRLRLARRRRLRVQRPVGRVAASARRSSSPSRATSAPRRAWWRPRAPASSSAAPSLAGQSLVFHRAGRSGVADPAARPRHGQERRAALRAPRAAAQPVLRRPRAALRALDLHAPGAAARPARPPRDRRATAASTARPRPAAATRATSRATAATAPATRAASRRGSPPARPPASRPRCGPRRSGRGRRTSRGCAAAGARPRRRRRCSAFRGSASANGNCAG